MPTHASPAKAPPEGAPRAWDGPAPARPGHLAALRRILRRETVQAAARVGPRGDACEQEAEQVAARVTSEPASAAGPEAAASPGAAQDPPEPARIDAAPADSEPVQRMEEPEPEPERPGEYLIQPRPVPGAPPQVPPEEPPDLDRRLAGLRLGGAPLPPGLRADMEARFGEDFAQVRLHRDADSAALAADLGARAFATGRHIAFAAGAYAPETQAGRHLIAHELTHVVQQRGPRAPGMAQQAPAAPVQRQEEEDLGFIARQAMRLVRRYAPRLEPVIRRGPVQWLRDQVAGAFDSLFGRINGLNLGAVVEQLGETFGTMVERATTIVTALSSGDCEPLFNAIDQLKSFVTEVAGNAWDKLTDFLEPIGDFFTDLWDSVGAPAVEWLQTFAGDLWTEITDFGAYIWEKTEPVRDWLGAAWSWLKEQIFGPEAEGTEDSEGGIVGWITDKAAAAFDWVKERTRPVWEPVSQAIDTVQELIPPSFVAELGEKMSEFSSDLETTAGEMEGGASVAENRAALAGILPSVSEIIGLIRARIVAANLWLLSTIGGVTGRISTFLSRLRANSVIGFLARGIGWLESAATRLMGWASDKVGGLFDWILRAFDFLSPFVERIATTVGQVISVVGELIRLPQLVLSSVWNLIPECIREPIKDFLVEQILGRIPVFSQFVAIPNLWGRLQATALQILRQLFVDGDIARAAWTFFSNLLSLIGLPPQLVVEILAKAAGAIGDILKDPIGFLINTLKAMKEGFSRFFANALTHLMNGITGWLFGHMREAGIEPPEDFSLRSVFGLVLQVLDVTRARILERLARQVDARTMRRIRQFLGVAEGVWAWVRILFEQGPAGLWRELVQRLRNLWDMVLDSVIGWVTERVITEVTKKLLTMLDPSGIMAVVNSVIALYRAIESFARYLREMLEIVSRVLDGIGGIARGAIDIAAGFLENAMARALPVAIGFLANQAGLGNLANRIREFMEGVRARVDAALDWLIERALSAGRAFLDMIRRGAAAVGAAARRVVDWWRARTAFEAEDGRTHQIYFRGSGRGARLMIESNPRSYRAFISEIEVPSEKEADKREALEIAERIDAAVADAERPAEGGTGADGEGGQHAQTIQGLVDQLGAVTARFMTGQGDTSPSSHPEYGPLHGGLYGTSVNVAKLKTPVAPGGSSPSSSLTNAGWEALRQRMYGGSTYYVRGHLLNDNLGGPGNTWANLSPLTQGANNRNSDSHLRGFETHVKRKVLEEDRIVAFNVQATYGRSSREREAAELEEQGGANDRLIAEIIRAERHVPRTFVCSAEEIDSEGKPVSGGFSLDFTVRNEIEQAPESYQLSPAERVTTIYLSRMDADEIATTFGIDPAHAEAIAAGQVDGVYRRWAQVAAAVDEEADAGAGVVERIRGAAGYNVRLYQKS